MTSSPEAPSAIEELCILNGVRLTAQRRAIAQALAVACEHPDALHLLSVVRERLPRISVATVYRALRKFEAAGVIEGQTFGARTRRYDVASGHHDHLFDEDSGDILEFSDPLLDRLQREVARRLGYRLIEHRLILVGRRLNEGVTTTAAADRTVPSRSAQFDAGAVSSAPSRHVKLRATRSPRN